MTAFGRSGIAGTTAGPGVASAAATLGRTGLDVTRLGLGTAALGHLYRPVEDAQADAAIRRSAVHGIRLYDTAPLYGRGLAERRLGAALRTLPRRTFVLSTKVGYVIDDPAVDATDPSAEPPRDYGFDAALRSIEGSLRRLGMDRVEIAYIHDPDAHLGEAIRGAYRALERLRAEGAIRAIGIGSNRVDTLIRGLLESDLDCVLLAGRFTLLDHEASAELLALCHERGVGVVIGGPFNSGILADPWAPDARFDYEAAPAVWRDRARRLHALCAAHGVPLKSAALRFPLRHPAVTAVLTGARSEREVDENVRMMDTIIPEELWEALRDSGLISAEAFSLGTKRSVGGGA